jgi:arginine exporter protein ArgO
MTMETIYLLGLYTARLELFRLFFFMTFGAFIWACFLYYDASGSSARKNRKRRATVYLVITGVVMLGMAATWLLSKTNIGWWFDK